MPNRVDRHRNTLLAGLANDDLISMIITDGHHLPDSLINTIIKAKDISNVIVVSDASPIAGLRPGKYYVSGNDAILEENGLLHNPEKKCMVGSSATMLECMNYLASLKLLSEEELARVGFYNPLRLIGVDADSIKNDRTINFDSKTNIFEII